MTVYDIINNIDIQSEYRFCYYDFEKEKRIYIPYSEAAHKEVKYMYFDRCTDFLNSFNINYSCIHFEIEMDE